MRLVMRPVESICVSPNFGPVRSTQLWEQDRIFLIRSNWDVLYYTNDTHA